MYFRKSFSCALLALVALSGCGGGGSGSAPAAPEQPNPTPTSPIPAPQAPSVYGPAKEFDRTDSYWTTMTSGSRYDGTRQTTLNVASSGAVLSINCDLGKKVRYYIYTDYPTGGGSVRYRIGSGSVVAQEWFESQAGAFWYLVPPTDDMAVVRSLYKNWDVVFEIQKSGSGVRTTSFNTAGFSAAIDQTRAECGWSLDDFPPANGWGKQYPTYPPADAREATYTPNVKQQFRLVAWKALNAVGQAQLMVRMGDETGPCVGDLPMTDTLLYVTQDGRRVPALSGSRIRQSCRQPIIVALNGDFSTDRPFVLTAHESHSSSLEPGAPISSISFN